MAGRVVIFDTSVLCCLLKVPGKETAGPLEDPLNHDKIAAIIDQENSANSTFVLPLASIIETGNHIAQARGDRYTVAVEFAKIIAEAATATSPWAAFTDQADLWGAERLHTLAKTWPALAKTSLSIGDATIKDVADYYNRAGFDVEILTGDLHLKAYQPARPVHVPRRRRKL